MNQDKHLQQDRSHFYGLCYLGYEWHTQYGLDYHTSIRALKALGAQSVRLWIHCDFILDDPTTINETNLKLMKEIIAEAYKNDLEIVGLNSHWFGGGKDMMGVPERDLSPGSPYQTLMADYQATWASMAKALPEIKIWEIGNEWNNDVFLHPMEEGTFSSELKADISTDLLYYGSCGIHLGNPAALTMIGGPVDVICDNFGDAKGYLKRIYENILSGSYPSLSTDDYFQLLCWHPYILRLPATDDWVRHNVEIYEMARSFEGRDKPVYFTELGWTDFGDEQTDKEQGDILTDTLHRIYEHMPFVNTVHWFRLFNDVNAYGWGGDKEVNFGLFTDPVFQDFAPKHKGFAFARLTNSKGDLHQFEKKAQERE